ncbi:tRNA-uridine aminocarboxypropyltransferase [Halopseudomonas sabulinigri]|uniref:tRNA-uridine aminocarboxypropyltransferase n=1 Tax=Halopseudomonas sabulinigri TaxID=472181 RepID=A0ABP9ZR00_9GAMM
MTAKQANAVQRLREAAIARSTRPFLARGARVKRCPECQLALTACICAQRPQLDTSVSFCLLMHSLEPLKPTNTGRLIAECLSDTQAFVWARTEVDAQLLALLADPAYQPYVVFPGEYALPEQVVYESIAPPPGRRPLLIILDATWTQARKMFRKSPYLAALPVLSMHTEQLSRYRLRRSTRDDHLCTVEVAIAALALAGDEQAALQLNRYFETFSDAYLSAIRLRPGQGEEPGQ